MTGASAFRGALNDYPHARHLCQSLPLDKDHPHRASCPMCYCFVCEVPAPCDEWGDGAAPDADHCRAVDGIPRWVNARDARRRARNAANGVRAAGADNIPDYFARRPRPAVDGKGGALNADADEGGGLEGDRVGFAGAAFGALFPEPERPEDVAAQTENLNEILAGLEDQEKAERDEIDPPPGALRVSLLRHQRRALAWALKRENGAEARGGHCRGGILADDQGLGKTVSMLALIVSAPPPETGANANGVARHVIRNRRDLGGDLGARRPPGEGDGETTPPTTTSAGAARHRPSSSAYPPPPPTPTTDQITSPRASVRRASAGARNAESRSPTPSESDARRLHSETATTRTPSPLGRDTSDARRCAGSASAGSAGRRADAGVTATRRDPRGTRYRVDEGANGSAALGPRGRRRGRSSCARRSWLSSGRTRWTRRRTCGA